MFNYFKNLFTSENDKDPGFISLVRVVLVLSTVALAIIAIVLALTPKNISLWRSVGVIFTMTILSGISLFLSYRNILWPGKALLPLTILGGVTFLAINANGLRDSAVMGFTFVIVITTLITGQKAIPLATFLTLLGVWTVAYADMTGITESTMAQKSTITDIAAISIIQIVTAVSLNGLMTRLNSALGASRSNEQILEQRVTDRTKALATVAEVSTAVSTILETNKLLQEVVDLSKERFGLYHAHIYLLNDAGDTLVLASGAGEVGRQMVAEKRAIPLDREQSLVARAAREKKGVTVNDVTQAPDFLPNPLLPDTHSEMAVPMMIGEQVIGVFDVQSEIAGRFTDTDISVQTTLASQVAAAVQNSRLYSQVEIAKQEAQSLVDYAAEGIAVVDLRTGQFTSPNENALKLFGLPYDEFVKVSPDQMSPVKQPDGSDSAEKAQEHANIVMQKGNHSFEWIHRNAQGIEFPCEIRGVRLPGHHPRLRISLLDITERKHLEEMTTQRAHQQETINLVTQMIQSTITIEDALQVAAREVGHVLGGRKTFVVLEPPVLAGDEGEKVANEKSRSTL